MKKVLRQLFYILLFGNFIVALAAAALVYESYSYFAIQVDKYFPAFVFFSTLSLYNFQRIYLLKNYEAVQNNFRINWIRSNKQMLWMLVFLGAGAAFASAVNIGRHLFSFSLMPVVMGLVYFLKPFSLRSRFGLKAFWIGAVWVVLCVWFPLLLNEGNEVYKRVHEISQSTSLMLRSLEVFFFVSALCLMFDQRDQLLDKKSGVKSLPVLVGSSIASLFVVILCAACSYVLYLQNSQALISKNAYYVSFSIAVIPALLTWFANEKRKESFYLLGVDGLIILKACLLWWVINN